MRMTSHCFIGGVPATGKSWLGNWLAGEQGYLHIDAEKDNGADFDRAGAHSEWDNLISTGHARSFIQAIGRQPQPVVLDWGFPTRYLYVVSALQEEGVRAWWLNADRALARAAFEKRGGIDLHCFDKQMTDVQREWTLIKYVFGSRIISGFSPDGSQRRPEHLWAEINQFRHMPTIGEMNASIEDARWFHQGIDQIVRGPQHTHDSAVVRRLFRGYLHCWKTVLHFVREAKGFGKDNKAWAAWCVGWQERQLTPDERAIMDQLRLTRDYDTHSGTIVVSGQVAAGLSPIVLLDPVETTLVRRELVTCTNQGLNILEQLVATHGTT